MKKKNRKRILGPAFSSYRGRIHIPNISTNRPAFGSEKVYLNSVCAGHVIVDKTSMFTEEKTAR